MQGYSTPSRKRILEYLEKNKNRTVTAADIENYLIEKECAVNKTTIYRFLDKLIIEKKIVKYAAEKGKRLHSSILRTDTIARNICIFNV